jgi:hypothetical protein
MKHWYVTYTQIGIHKRCDFGRLYWPVIIFSGQEVNLFLVLFCNTVLIHMVWPKDLLCSISVLLDALAIHILKAVISAFDKFN